MSLKTCVDELKAEIASARSASSRVVCLSLSDAVEILEILKEKIIKGEKE